MFVHIKKIIACSITCYFIASLQGMYVQPSKVARARQLYNLQQQQYKRTITKTPHNKATSAEAAQKSEPLQTYVVKELVQNTDKKAPFHEKPIAMSLMHRVKSDVYLYKQSWADWLKSLWSGSQFRQIDELFNNVSQELYVLANSTNDFTDSDADAYVKDIAKKYAPVLRETKNGKTIEGLVLERIFTEMDIIYFYNAKRPYFSRMSYIVNQLAKWEQRLEGIESEKEEKMTIKCCTLLKAIKKLSIEMSPRDIQLTTAIINKIDEQLTQKYVLGGKKLTTPRELRFEWALEIHIVELLFLATIYASVTSIQLPLLNDVTRTSLLQFFGLNEHNKVEDLIAVYNTRETIVSMPGFEDKQRILRENYNALLNMFGFTRKYNYIVRAPFWGYTKAHEKTNEGIGKYRE